MEQAAAKSGSPPGRRARFMQWWLHSPFQAVWMRLAVQAGVSTLLILCTFSAPAVWQLHEYDPILANPVLVLVLANLSLLFTANTGLPVARIGIEAVLGSLVGGVATLGVVYLVQGITGGNNSPGVLKAAMLLLFGSILLFLSTASRFRWQQHISLAALLCTLTIAVAISVVYHAQTRLWSFVVHWWWYIGLSVLFSVPVGTLVLPLPAGWVVRKQLARALRQEGAVLEAAVLLLTVENPAAGSVQPVKSAEHAAEGAADGAEVGSYNKQEDEEDEDDDLDFPPSPPFDDQADMQPASLTATLRRLWHTGHGSSMRRVTSLGTSLSHLSFAASGRRSSSKGLQASKRVQAAAAALGVRPDLYAAVEPIYRMSEPAAASIQAAWAHMRYTSAEVDAYRRTHIFPSLPFHRLLLLARTMLSSAMMLVYPLQSGAAKLGASRKHAGHLQRAAAEIKHCCNCLAAVLRHNAPAGPALEQLGRLELAFWELQQAVGASEMAAAAAAAQVVAESPLTADQAELQPPGAGAAAPPPAAAADGNDEAAADAAQDSLALHLSLSMLFTCCTRVRGMYQILPQALARDQEGVSEAVAAHFATSSVWHAVQTARAVYDADAASPQLPHSPRKTYHQSQLLPSEPLTSRSLLGSRSAAALDRLVKPSVHVAEAVAPRQRAGWAQRISAATRLGFSAVERGTGFSRGQTSLGLQLAVAWIASMFLVIIPSVYEALARRSVWAVFIIVVVHEPLVGSVVWKSFLRFSGTVVAGILGLGALYFSVLCNGLSFENHPAKFIAMTAALVVLTMPLAAGVARYGVQNAYFFIVSCLIMYTVALPGYAHTSPMPVLALWRLACTAIGLALELVVAVCVFPVSARSAAHASTAGALRGMADVAALVFSSVLPAADDSGGQKAEAASAAGNEAGAGQQQQQQQQRPQQHEEGQEQQAAEPGSPDVRRGHVAVKISTEGWQGKEVAHGAVLSRIYKPTMESYGRINTLRMLLAPLRVEYHPFKQPHRFPLGPGRLSNRLCRRMLNVITCFAVAMDSHHTESVPLLAPHAAELAGLVAQLREALLGLSAMVAGSVSVESAALTVAALERHAHAFLLRVLLSEPLPGLSTADTTQGLAFVAMMFHVAAVARLLCLALGSAFCADDVRGLSAASAVLRDDARWTADGRLLTIAAQLVSEALSAVDGEDVVAEMPPPEVAVAAAVKAQSTTQSPSQPAHADLAVSFMPTNAF